MLAVSPLSRDTATHGHQVEMDEDFSGSYSGTTTVAMLDDINFDELFMGLEDGDILPDLEVDPAELLCDFNNVAEESGSTSVAVQQQRLDSNNSVAAPETIGDIKSSSDKCLDDQNLICDDNEIQQEEEVLSSMSTVKEEDALAVATPSMSSSTAHPETGRKSSPGIANGGTNGKRKVKVDWTPELHRRFVQAVEQLGVDKAVPSRILEIMGVDCLTRHNIASHLQKYRSHRKHLLAREAEAASWSQRRQMYTAAAAAAGTPGLPKREHTVMNPWLAPTMGFPHPPLVPPPAHHHHHMQAAATFRPLHVWGHPSIDQPPPMMMHHHHHPWPRPAVVASPPPPHARAPAAAIPPWTAQPDPSYWYQPHYPKGSREGWHPSAALTQGTPCYPPHPMRLIAGPPVAGVVPHPMYRPPPVALPPASKQIPVDAHPSKESIDAAIGEVLEKPWQPLPLGLKPPALDTVMGELQKQGISKIPPTCSA